MSFIRVKRSLIKLLSAMLAATLFCACGEEKKLPEEYESTKEGTTTEVSFAEAEEETNYVKIEMTDGGIIIIELYPDIAPITVANFKKLVGEKFYDGIIFHRVVKDFVIQAGDPTGTGAGGSKETIKGEFGINGVTNNLSHTTGVVSMARSSGLNDSASSQFFICLNDKHKSSLDGQYASFGKVISGMDTVLKIGSVKVNSKNKPTEDQTIATVRFVTVQEK